MRTPELPLRRVLTGVACIQILSGCGSSELAAPAQPVAPQVVASVQVTIPGSMEPLDVDAPDVALQDADHRALRATGRTITWTSSDSSVVTFITGSLTARHFGTATVTATVDGVSGSATVHVGWQSTAWLVLGEPPGSLVRGGYATFNPLLRNARRVPVDEMTWTVTDTSVVRLESPGRIAALKAGVTTVIARYLDLVDSTRITVLAAPLGFGYFYSGDALVTDWYDTFEWSAAAGKGFSTAGVNPSATWQPPYASWPELGWVGPHTPARDALFHVVPLENVSCSVYLQQETGFNFVTAGAPLLECIDRSSPYLESVRVEFIAFRRAEFSGTLGVVRSLDGHVNTVDAGLTETSPSSDSREYSMPDIAPGSIYWFVTPGAPLLGACSLAPTATLTAPAVARVRCAPVPGYSDSTVFWAVGFGADARHGDAPIGFAEISTTGSVTRLTDAGINITATAASQQSVNVVLSGAAMSAYTRVPAVLITAIAPTAVACSITEPVRAAPTIVTLQVSCPAAVTGFTLGAMY